MTANQYEPSTIISFNLENELFITIAEQTFEDGYPFDLALVHRKQQKVVRNRNSKLSTYMRGPRYGYFQQ